MLSPEDQRLLLKSWSGDGRSPSRTCRCSTSCATRSATCRSAPTTTAELDDHVEARDLQELTTAADREYAPTGRAWAPPTHRIEDDGFAHVLIDEAQDLTPMQWRMVGRRGRGRVLDHRRRPGAVVLAGARRSPPRPGPRRSRARTLHEFHLSTNYRNSSEIYEYAAAYAERVGLDADLPTAVRSTGVEPTVHHRVADLEAATRPRPSPSSPARSPAPSASWCPSPAARRSTPGWRPGRSSPTTPPAPRAAVDSSVPPSGDDRIVVLTGLDTKGLEFDGIVVVRPQEIEDESATGRATLYVVLTRATQLLTTIS